MNNEPANLSFSVPSQSQKPTLRLKRLPPSPFTFKIVELREEIKSLQKAVAQERGENHRFREEVRAYLQRGHL
jgi:hypothetical protein